MSDPERTFAKSEAFRKWFERLARWLRRNSIRNEFGECVMPGAAKFVRQGGKLVQAVFKNGRAL